MSPNCEYFLRTVTPGSSRWTTVPLDRKADLDSRRYIRTGVYIAQPSSRNPSSTALSPSLVLCVARIPHPPTIRVAHPPLGFIRNGGTTPERSEAEGSTVPIQDRKDTGRWFVLCCEGMCAHRYRSLLCGEGHQQASHVRAGTHGMCWENYNHGR